MIQRIQSIWLGLAAAASFCLLLFPFAELGGNTTQMNFLSDGFFELKDDIILMVSGLAIGVLSLVAIFLFKNRKVQGKIGRLALVCNIICVVLIGIYLYQEYNLYTESVGSDIAFRFGIILPFLTLLFISLGLRGISKDEKLVKSMDRLR